MTLPPQVEVVEQIQYYQISGRSAKELLRQIELLGPRNAAGTRTMVGRAQSEVSWKLEVAESTGECRLAHYQVQLNVTITLPQWREERQASPVLRAKWAQFVQRLELHERGHRDIAVHAARAVGQLFAHAAPGARCRGYAERLGMKADGLWQRYRARDARYDARTEHGKRQGVELR